MSEPKRYDRREIYDVTYQAVGDECLPEPSENGEFVRWEDYARLQAEVERLMQEYSDATNHYNKLHNDLQAEVERLRKAGDELALSLAAFHLLHRGSIDTTTQPDIVAWNAAKEGKPSV